MSQQYFESAFRSYANQMVGHNTGANVSGYYQVSYVQVPNGVYYGTYIPSSGHREVTVTVSPAVTSYKADGSPTFTQGAYGTPWH